MKKAKLFTLAGSILLVLILAVLPFISACAGEEPTTTPAPEPTPTPTQEPAPAEEWPKVLTVATTPEGTVAYLAGAALAKEIESRLGIPTTVRVAHTAERAVLLGKKEVDVSMLTSDTLFSAIRGNRYLADVGKLPVRYLIKTYPLALHIILRTPLETIPELEGKRCMFNQVPTPCFKEAAEALLKYHGMTFDDIVLLNFDKATEAVEGMVAGTTDAVMDFCGGIKKGAPSWVEATMAKDVNFYSLSKEEAEFIRKEYSYWSTVTFPAGAYTGQDQPLLSVSQFQNIVCRADLPDDLVYEISKILLDTCGPDTPGDFLKVHANLDWTLNAQITDALYSEVAPFHPGMVKYLKERGVWTAKEDGIQAELIALTK